LLEPFSQVVHAILVALGKPLPGSR